MSHARASGETSKSTSTPTALLCAQLRTSGSAAPGHMTPPIGRLELGGAGQELPRLLAPSRAANDDAVAGDVKQPRRLGEIAQPDCRKRTNPVTPGLSLLATEIVPVAETRAGTAGWSNARYVGNLVVRGCGPPAPNGSLLPCAHCCLMPIAAVLLSTAPWL